MGLLFYASRREQEPQFSDVEMDSMLLSDLADDILRAQSALHTRVGGELDLVSHAFVDRI
jgi:hypothetical protein